MVDRSRRILWLLNHIALNDAEAPLLRSLGFEVYTPKHSVTFSQARSYAVRQGDDASLSISARDLEVLNRCDFFAVWPSELAQIVNRAFDIVICQFDLTLIDECLRHFRGKIFLRAFGREQEQRYSDLLGIERLALIAKEKGRVWFAPSYQEIIPVEGPVLRDCSVFLPHGIPERILTEPDRWSGAGNFLLFVCPDIVEEPYYRAIHREFRDWFGDLPYRIGGRQRFPVDDPGVLGFLPTAPYEELYRQARVMFYHSREKRHQHIHPLEAVARGLPLVYMRDGWLGTRGDLPGACSALGEARRLVERLMAGDQELAQRLRSAQGVLLDHYRRPNVEAAWRERFLPLVETMPAAVAPAPAQLTAPDGRVGIWLELRPDSPLQTEGIGRLLGMWLQGLISVGIRPVVVTPVWAGNQVASALQGMGLGQGQVEVMTPSGGVQPLMRLMIWLIKPRVPGLSWWRSAMRRVVRGASVGAELVIRALARVIMWSWLTVLVVLLGLVVSGWWMVDRQLVGLDQVGAIALGSLLLIVVGVVLLVGWRLGVRHWQPERVPALGLVRKLRRLRKGDRFSIFANPITRVAARVYLAAIALENRRMVDRANARQDITRWIVPNPSFVSATGLKRPLLMCVPDLVYLDFPGGFSLKWFTGVEHRARQLADRANAFAAYSADVVRRHVSHLEPAGRTVALIPHAPMDYYGMLYDGAPAERLSASQQVDTAIRFHGSRAADPSQQPWLAKLSLRDVPYLFVSSQNRPHKNLLTLLRAFVVLLRRKRVSLKLVTTGHLDQVPEVEDFIHEQQLNDDVISLPDLDPVAHAAVYRLATLTVCPTLFEGGFPFVFSESVSVGTPVILSRIACVEEMLSPADLALMTFDPLDSEALAEAIVRALAGRTALIERQRELLAEQRKRTWTDVARDLLAALDRAVDHRRGR